MILLNVFHCSYVKISETIWIVIFAQQVTFIICCGGGYWCTYISVHGEGFIQRENIMEVIYDALYMERIHVFTVTDILINYTVNNPYNTSWTGSEGHLSF